MDGIEDYLPLWLELRLDDEAWLFELRAGEERAVVVGSHPTADVHVARQGVASTHFHFERERDGIVVVPGYRAALIVDHLPAPEPTAISKEARVEFCGALLKATVHDVPPLHMLLQARHGTDRMMRGPDYLERLPEDWDTTVVGVAAVATASSPGEQASSDSIADELDMMTTTAWRAAAPPAPLGPQGTLIMQRPLDDDLAPQAPEPRKPQSLPPIAPPERIRLDPWSAPAAASPESSPTRVSVPHPHGTGVRSNSGGTATPQLALPPSASTATPSLAPTGTTVPPPKKRASALEQLGMVALRHPVRVAAIALPICAVLALAIVGAARLAGRSPMSASASASFIEKRAPTSAAPLTTSTARPAPVSAQSSAIPQSPALPIAGSAASSQPQVLSPTPSVSAVRIPARTTAQRAPRPPKRVFLSE